MGVGILATRAITGLGGAFMALGMLYLPLLIICLPKWAIPQRAARGHLLAFLTQAMAALCMLQVAAKTFDLINAAAKAGAKNALHNFVQLGKTTKNIFLGMGNAFVSIIEMMINNAARKIDFLSTKANGMAKVPPARY